MKSAMYACCEEDLDFLRAYLAGPCSHSWCSVCFCSTSNFDLSMRWVVVYELKLDCMCM